MIRPSNKPRTPQEAIRDFSDWAWILSNGRNELIVTIAVYVDDSGTHDPTGKLTGSREATFSGLAAPVEEWRIFCGQWQSVLNKYSIPYFHFCEWSDAFHEQKNHGIIKSGPFVRLEKHELNSVVAELATIAGAGNKLLLGVGLSADLFQKDKDKGYHPKDADPYLEAVQRFFSGYDSTMAELRPEWRRMTVHFIFDQTSDRSFRNGVQNAFIEAKKHNRNFDKLAFADKKTDLPLQAADMVAYRSRQLCQNFRNDKIKANWPEVDLPLFKAFFDLHTRKPEVFEKYMRQMVLIEALFKHSNEQPGK
jgi:hypothetical protein